MNKINEELLQSLPKISKDAFLPLSHVTSWSNLKKIISDRGLKTNVCPIFKEELIYFSYGDVAYRPSRKKYAWNNDFPVVMFFFHNLLTNIFRFFPFDTGAIAVGRYRHLDKQIKDFRSNYFAHSYGYTSPRKWVNMCYGSVINYIGERTPIARSDFSDSHDKIYNIYRIYNNKTCKDVNYKIASTVECHSANSIPLAKNLLWVGVPEHLKEELNNMLIDNNLNNLLLFYYNQESINGELPEDLMIASQKFIYLYLKNINFGMQR